MVARMVRDHEAASSSLATSTIFVGRKYCPTKYSPKTCVFGLYFTIYCGFRCKKGKIKVFRFNYCLLRYFEKKQDLNRRSKINSV